MNTDNESQMIANEDTDFYQSIFTYSMDAVLYTVPDGQILAANASACTLFGYSEPDIRALGRHGLVDPSSPQLPNLLHERETTGKAQGELIFIRSNGSRFPGWVNSAVFETKSGQTRTVMIIRDLTEIKQTENTLRQSMSELGELYNYAPCGYHSLNADGNLLKINRTELEWLGYELEEVINRPYETFLSPESREVARASFRQFTKRGVEKDLDISLLRKDGSTLPVLLNSTAVYDQNGQFVMSRTILTDLTVQKKLDKISQDRIFELQSIMDASNIAITLVKNRIQVWSNRRMEELFGYSREEMANQSTRMFYLSQEDYEEFGRNYSDVLLKGRRYISEVQMRRSDGIPLWVEISGKAVSPTDPSLGSIWFLQNITARKFAEMELDKSIRDIEDLYENAPCGYHSVDASGKIIKVNQTELNWLGYQRSELLGENIRKIHSPPSQLILEEKLERFSHHEPIQNIEFELVKKDGSRLPVLLNATAIYDDDGNFVMSRSTIVDLSERKKLEHELQRQAHLDFLTGLYNRAFFHEVALKEISRSKRLGQPLGFLILDVDHFKYVNDTYGHDAGDSVLTALGQCCLETLRQIDTVGRWGGEEFVVLLPGIEGIHIQDAAERLRTALAMMHVNIDDDTTISFTVSIGASWLTETDTAIESIVKRADVALYQAKHAGRNRVRLNPEPAMEP